MLDDAAAVYRAFKLRMKQLVDAKCMLQQAFRRIDLQLPEL